MKKKMSLFYQKYKKGEIVSYFDNETRIDDVEMGWSFIERKRWYSFPSRYYVGFIKIKLGNGENSTEALKLVSAKESDIVKKIK